MQLQFGIPRGFLAFSIAVTLAGSVGNVFAGDWPMWRYDSGRGAASPDELPEKLHLQWIAHLPEPAPAWPVTQAKLQFDIQAEPVILGERIFVPSSREDSVTALNTRTGREIWKFHANGPVRFAPVAADGRVFFNSDDGFLYAIDAETGKLIWKVNGGPKQRLIIGNHRLISSWPARGGVVLHDGKLFFAASIWPFMGIFIHAVDPESGEILWTNSGDGTNWTVQPHNAPSFAGVVPQGHLAAAGRNLVVPGGRSTPAIYDTETGELRHFAFDKREGGHEVGALGDLYFCGGIGRLMASGKKIEGDAPAVFGPDFALAPEEDDLRLWSTDFKLEEKVSTDRRGVRTRELVPEFREISDVDLDEDIPGTWRIRAGSRFFAAGGGKIAAYELENPKPVWKTEIEGEVYSMLAGDDRLFVVTREGQLLCFGAEKPEIVWESFSKPDDEISAPAKHADLVSIAGKLVGDAPGYGLVLGVEDGSLVRELVADSSLQIIAVDPDQEKIDQLRRDLRASYGVSFAAIVDDPAEIALPPYFARFITTETPAAAEKLADNAFEALRPYGGAMLLGERVEGEFEGGEWEEVGGFFALRRNGPLPDTDDWTHQYANAAQTVVSRDKRVKAPLGVLWFGGPSHAGILPRHGHGPSPQVAGGRLFIEGPNLLRAVDVYTGSLLWEADLPGFGEYYDTTAHFAGAGEIGSNYVSLADRIYAVYGESILELNTENGETLREFVVDPPAYFGHVSVSGKYLVATCAPVDAGGEKSEKKNAIPAGSKVLIPPGANWRYLGGDEAPDNWNLDNFDDRSWKTGKAGFGYGDGDDATTIDMRGKFSAVRIRHVFEAEADEELVLRINYDDGFVAWLNGEEVLRKGVSKNRVESHEASGFEHFSLRGAKLRQGRNLLAIEGRNTNLTSSDFTLDPVLFSVGDDEPAAAETAIPQTRFASGSRRLVVFDRNSGKQLWKREAKFNFRHNNIAVGSDRVFCIDSITEQRAAALSRRGIRMEGKPSLLALDLETGKELWKESKNVFGTFLNYSTEHDLVVQASSKYRDRAADESGKGISVFEGATGELVWSDEQIGYGGPCLLWKDKILTNGSGGFSIDLRTGKASGWDYHRYYGCNTAIGGENLITFRSGAAGIYDLLGKSGTGNLGGFRSSCTNNLIPANGVLNAPDYTRTCSCSYQNQTSLALIHMAEAEFWAFGEQPEGKRFGINFGAPGDRRSAAGVLFFEYPESSGKNDKIEIEANGEWRVYRTHSSMLKTNSASWIAASGVEGIEKLTIKRPSGVEEDAECEIRLYFAEVSKLNKGERKFDIRIQGELAKSGFDIVAEGGLKQVVIQVFEGVPFGDEIELRFESKGQKPAAISGIEILID